MLFRNVEIEYTEEYKLLLDLAKILPKNTLVSHEANRGHLVLQDGRFYFNLTGPQVDTKDKSLDRTRVIGFDGMTNRTAQYEIDASQKPRGVANIRSGDPESPYFSDAKTPQSFGGGGGRFKLSSRLDGSCWLVPPLADRKLEQRVVLQGHESVGGLDCAKILIATKKAEQKPPQQQRESRTFFWICPERNYLPVKCASFHQENMSDHPDNLVEASEWKEIELGIWLPFRSVSTNFENSAGLVASNQTVVSVVRASLRPQYPASFFQNVPIPAGLVVYVVKEGQIVESYIQGGERPSGTTGAWTLVKWLLILPALCLIIMGLRLLYRWRTRAKEGIQKTG
jgi:hypothetical protein